MDSIEVRLIGVERRYSYTHQHNNRSRVYRTHTHVSLAAKIAGHTLTPGVFNHAVRFDLPPGLPPSYRDDYASVVYRLEVQVIIPWWPDRKVAYEVTIPPPSWPAAPTGAQVFVSNADGPRPDRVYLEASLDPGEAYLGGALRGVLSVANTKKVRRIKIGLDAFNTALFHSTLPICNARRYEAPAITELPADGQSTSFAIQIPPTEWPSFQAALFRHTWSLEIRAIGAWSEDVVMSIPIMVAPRAGAQAADGRLDRLPPVGHERRAKAWAFVAQRFGMENDAASEVMTKTVGPITMRIELEQREKHGLTSVATLSWPSTGTGVRVAERRWSDTLLGGGVTMDDPMFDERFVVRAGEAAQARALLPPDVRRALASAHESVFEDDGAMLAASGGGHRLEQLEQFVAAAHALARAIEPALPLVPPPACASHCFAAWADYASAHDAVLERGSLSIRKLRLEGVEVDVENRFNDKGGHVETRVVHELDETLPLDTEAARRALEEAAAKGVMHQEGTLWVRITPLPARPSDVEQELASFAKLARSLRPRGPLGPYR